MLNFQLPDSMRSTDFKVFEGLLKIMTGAIKKNIDEITNLKDSEKCYEHMLPLLAQSIACPYFYETTPDINRLIIKTWWWMMQHKGTIPAMQTATSLGMLAYEASKTGNINYPIIFSRSIEISVSQNTGLIFIKVLYQKTDSTDEENEQIKHWIKTIVDYVRPAGFQIIFLPSLFDKALIS